MDKDYFNSLKNSVQDSERSVNNVINSTDQTLLTVKVDIDCKVYCDGDFLDLLEANKTKQFTIETGPHLITIESEKYEELVEDREIDAKGRNNLVVVKDMKQKEQEFLQKEEEKIRLAEIAAEVKRKEEDNQKFAQEGQKNNGYFTVNINISRNELGELLSHFDQNSEFTINQQEFTNAPDKLLNGESISVSFFEPNNNALTYKEQKITITDIVKGLEKAANGTINNESNRQYAKQSFYALMLFDDDPLSFDTDNAETLMNIILFKDVLF
jgi:hypothetical protein